MWRATIFTLFPEMFPGPLGGSLSGEALSRDIWALNVQDIRAQGLAGIVPWMTPRRAAALAW